VRIVNGRKRDKQPDAKPGGDALLFVLMGIGSGGVGATLIGALLNDTGGLVLATLGLLTTVGAATFFCGQALRAWLPPK
jgi:hypothetical protein